MAVSVRYGCACGVPLACRGYVLVENYISTRSAHFSTVFFHTCLKLRNRQSGQAVFAWGRDFHTLFHTLWKTGFCGFVAGCRTGVGYDIFCDFCIIGLVCLLGYLVNRVGLWGRQGGGRLPTLPCRNPAGGAGGTSPADLATVVPGGGLPFWLPACPFTLACFSAPLPRRGRISPRPALAERSSPPGKGEIQSIFRRGLPPPAPLQSGGKRHWLCFWKTVLLAFREKVFHRGQGFKCGKRYRRHWKLSPQVQQVPHGFRLRGCKGRSPLHKITFSLPLPAGKGVGGMGAKFFFYPKNPAGRSSQCRTGTSRIQNPQQKRLSRFCKTQNPSRHPIQQGNHGSGRQRKSSAK